MVDVDKLTDAELRTKLQEYGFPVMPITGTTRKVMTKKLKMLIENKNKIKQDGRRSLTRYSSEEESDNDSAKPTSKRDKNRRVTMAAPPPRPPSRTSRANNFDSSTDSEQPTSTTRSKTTTVTTRATKTAKSVRDEFDTGSDSESEITNSSEVKKPSPIRSAASYTPNKYGYGSTDESFSTGYSSAASPGRYSMGGGGGAGSLDRLNQIRARLSLGNTGYEKPAYSLKSPDSAETPFLSNFTRNLSQLSTANISGDIIKEHDVNGAGGYARALRSPNYGRSANLARDLQASQASRIFKNNVVSFAVVGLAMLFFLMVAIAYMGMRSTSGGDNSIESAGYTIPYCVKNEPGWKRGVNCVIDEDVMSSITLYKYLKERLHELAVGHRCGGAAAAASRPFMTEREVVDYAKKKYGLNEEGLRVSLAGLEVLTFSNPSWGISVVQVDNDASAVGEGDRVESMEQVLRDRQGTKVIALAVLNPSVPLACSIYNKVYAIVNTVLFLVAVSGSLYLTNKAFKYYKYYAQKQRDEVFFMVERILDIVQSNAAADGGDGPAYVVINHVRDMILPIKNRKGMERIWTKAVKFINENESRVRVEIQHVQGEPYEVWRWLGNPGLSPAGSPRTKTWQGQAFETQVGSVNSLPCSPTPCLKVRGMVEDGDRNLHTIREAVLSKCAHQCRILHCAVDTTTNCVYLKCADTSDAAVAYRNLHGWWYAGTLVTVKYLRLERYMQRFPDSPAKGPPFLTAITPAADWSN